MVAENAFRWDEFDLPRAAQVQESTAVAYQAGKRAGNQGQGKSRTGFWQFVGQWCAAAEDLLRRFLAWAYPKDFVLPVATLRAGRVHSQLNVVALLRVLLASKGQLVDFRGVQVVAATGVITADKGLQVAAGYLEAVVITSRRAVQAKFYLSLVITLVKVIKLNAERAANMGMVIRNGVGRQLVVDLHKTIVAAWIMTTSSVCNRGHQQGKHCSDCQRLKKLLQHHLHDYLVYCTITIINVKLRTDIKQVGIPPT